MYCYVDESGNTGANLFDPAQPVLYYGLITSKTNLDVTAEPLLRAARAKLGVERLHANELGVRRLSDVALSLGRFALKRDVRFSLYKIVKPDHAIIVSLRGRPSELVFAPMVSLPLCPTLSTALKSKFCLLPMVNAAGIGRMMTNCALWRRALSATVRWQPQRGDTTFAARC